MKFRIRYGFEYGFVGVSDESYVAIIEAENADDAAQHAHEELEILRENCCPSWVEVVGQVPDGTELGTEEEGQ